MASLKWVLLLGWAALAGTPDATPDPARGPSQQRFDDCMTGPEAAGYLSRACVVCDLNDDMHVDLRDWQIVQNAWGE